MPNPPMFSGDVGWTGGLSPLLHVFSLVSVSLNMSHEAILHDVGRTQTLAFDRFGG